MNAARRRSSTCPWRSVAWAFAVLSTSACAGIGNPVKATDTGAVSVAIWLVPVDAQERQLEEVVADLARRHVSSHYVPWFQPHMTLCKGTLRRDELDREFAELFGQVDAFADQQVEFSLAAGGVEGRKSWSQFVVLPLDARGAPPEATDEKAARSTFPAIRDCQLSTDADAPDRVMLHVSLAYDKETSHFKLVEGDANKENLPRRIVFGSIEVVTPYSGEWSDLLEGPGKCWAVLRSRRLLVAPPPLQRVVAGGQTGVDQAAWRAARLHRIQIGGWCPPGRNEGNGNFVPAEFPCEETPNDRSPDHPDVARSERTEWNVRDSDATLVLRRWKKGGFVEVRNKSDVPDEVRNAMDQDPGTALTIDHPLQLHRPVALCDPTSRDDHAVDSVVSWIVAHKVQTLNVGGPSESTQSGIGGEAEQFLLEVFARLRSRSP